MAFRLLALSVTDSVGEASLFTRFQVLSSPFTPLPEMQAVRGFATAHMRPLAPDLQRFGVNSR